MFLVATLLNKLCFTDEYWNQLTIYICCKGQLFVYFLSIVKAYLFRFEHIMAWINWHANLQTNLFVCMCGHLLPPKAAVFQVKLSFIMNFEVGLLFTIVLKAKVINLFVCHESKLWKIKWWLQKYKFLYFRSIEIFAHALEPESFQACFNLFYFRYIFWIFSRLFQTPRLF